MKRALSAVFVVTAVLSLAPCARASWMLFDNFEGAATAFDKMDNGSIVADASDPSGTNHVYLPNKSPSAAASSIGTVSNPIAGGTIGTLYFEVNGLGWAGTVNDLNISVGMTDLETSPGGQWGNYNGYGIFKETGTAPDLELGLYARNGGGSLGGPGEQLCTAISGSEWYKVWIVYDNNAKTYDLHAEGPGLTGQQLLADDFIFRRDPAGGPIDAVMLIWNTDHQADFYLDNVYLDNTGQNLTAAPEPASLILLGLGGLGALLRRRR